MKILFLTISDRLFFPGTLAAINSLLDHLSVSGNDFQIAVVNSGEFNTPMSAHQCSALEYHPNVEVYSHLYFDRESRVLGAWQLKAYAAHQLSEEGDFELLVGFDSDLFFASDISDTVQAAVDSGMMMGGRDGDTVHYDNSYAPYGISNLPQNSDKYMSTSCYFCPLTEENRAILKRWAEYSDKAVYGPQDEKVYAGHGDQGVLNAVIHASNGHTGVSLLPNRLWSQHWTFEDDVLEWNPSIGALSNYSVKNSDDAPRMFTVHCGGSDKFWAKSHSEKRISSGMSQRWAYAMWLRYLFLGEITPWKTDPMMFIAPESKHLLGDLVFYHQLVTCMMPNFSDAWENMPLMWFDRCTKLAEQHRMMTLSPHGSMTRYIDLVSSLPDSSIVVEVGSYLGGSVATLALATLHKNHSIISVESFTGNRDNTVDGWPLPSLQSYLENLKQKWAFLNIQTIQLPSQLASERFPDQSIDFVFIDGGHSEEDVLRDIQFWNPKVRKGGMLAGDDYGWEGVRLATKKAFGQVESGSELWWVVKT